VIKLPNLHNLELWKLEFYGGLFNGNFSGAYEWPQNSKYACVKKCEKHFLTGYRDIYTIHLRDT